MVANNQRAVVVFVEVDGDWIDMHNVAPLLVEGALAPEPQPRGVRLPLPVTAERGGTTLSGKVTEVMDLAEAVQNGYVRIEPRAKAFPQEDR